VATGASTSHSIDEMNPFCPSVSMHIIREVLSVRPAITAPVAVTAVTAGLLTRFSHSRRTQWCSWYYTSTASHLGHKQCPLDARARHVPETPEGKDTYAPTFLPRRRLLRPYPLPCCTCTGIHSGYSRTQPIPTPASSPRPFPILSLFALTKTRSDGPKDEPIPAETKHHKPRPVGHLRPDESTRG
jgi:hypothetical protein